MKSGKPKSVRMAKAAPMKGAKPGGRASKAHPWPGGKSGKGGGFMGNC